MRKESELTSQEAREIERKFNYLYSRNNYPILRELETDVRMLMFRAPIQLDSGDMDSISHLFAKHIIGFDLIENDKDWEKWKSEPLMDTESFWGSVQKLFPELLSESRFDWLVKNDPEGVGALHFICSMYFEKMNKT